jgi:CRP/FNR family cyclic AMP-dependent transcriptional regulator
MDERGLLAAPLFAGLDKRERRAVAQRADEIDVPEGKELATEDEVAHQFFVIKSGTAAVTRQGNHVRDLGPGDFFGEIGILASERRTATVTATSPMDLIVMTRGALRSLRREEPDVAQRLDEVIEERLAADQG